MALVVEDGTGKADAESYVSVADATAYHLAQGNAAWAAIANDTLREQALRRATSYMEQVYRMSWAGSRVTNTQALSWPRAWVPVKDSPGGYGGFPDYVAQDVVPVQVSRACAELALRAAAGSLAPDLGAQKKSTTVGPISVTYADGTRQTTKYRAVDNMVSIYFGGSGSPMNLGLARA